MQPFIFLLCTSTLRFHGTNQTSQNDIHHKRSVKNYFAKFLVQSSKAVLDSSLQAPPWVSRHVPAFALEFGSHHVTSHKKNKFEQNNFKSKVIQYAACYFLKYLKFSLK